MWRGREIFGVGLPTRILLKREVRIIFNFRFLEHFIL